MRWLFVLKRSTCVVSGKSFCLFYIFVSRNWIEWNLRCIVFKVDRVLRKCTYCNIFKANKWFKIEGLKIMLEFQTENKTGQSTKWFERHWLFSISLRRVVSVKKARFCLVFNLKFLTQLSSPDPYLTIIFAKRWYRVRQLVCLLSISEQIKKCLDQLLIGLGVAHEYFSRLGYGPVPKRKIYHKHCNYFRILLFLIPEVYQHFSIF